MAQLSLNSSLETEIKSKKPVFSEENIVIHGLEKQILKKGISWQTPFPGDEVEVHFSGQIEGGVYLDSSRDKGFPLRFKLGQGEVIKGLDEGVATMKKGERATFKVPPNLAYGEAGSPPLIPANTTLVFDVEMLSWNSIRDVTGDGGVLKKIIKEGEGWSTPRNGDEVLVKYEARLQNGILISESEDGVEFCLGDGYLCPGLSKAVKTMRRGEKAELAVNFCYGFNQNGNLVPDIEISTVPPSSNIAIQVELVSWRSVIDVTGDKKVLKKIVKSGEGFDRPNEGSQVKVIYTGKLEDGTVLERNGTNEEPFEFITLEEQVNESLDRAIMTMKKGEHATVTVDAEYLRGHDVSAALPANSLIHYEVELIDFIKEKPFWKMETHEKLEACERKKVDGNVLFKAAKFGRASKKYEKAVKYIEFDHCFTDDEKCLANSLRVSCNLNNAACKLKLGEYLEATRLCTKVLELDPFNVKALFRRSQAYLKASELEKAEADIKKALSIDPNNREVQLESKKLKEKQKEYAKHQAELFSTMLSRMC